MTAERIDGDPMSNPVMGKRAGIPGL